jgi:predicted deacetylase
MIAAFPAAARGVIAHLVVPNWQGRQPIDADRDFAARLRALEGTPVLHGWTHSLGPDLLNWVLYGHDNRSEFARLDAGETRARLARGHAMLTGVLGRAAGWFCAPRWQGNPHLEGALRALGLRGIMTRQGLRDFGRGTVALPALNFDDGGRAFMIWPALAVRRVRIGRLLAERRPFRLVLHPDDLDRPAVFAQFRALAERLEAEGWQPLGPDAMVARLLGAA